MIGLDREAYPFASHYVLRPNNLRYHYLDEGLGDPVVMLHGNPTWSYTFRRLIPTLAKQNRVIVPDHMGCGLSDKPSASEYSFVLKSRVDDLEALLDTLGMRNDITLILHDWGGMIGMAYAARHPERISRIVAMNTAAFGLPKSKRFPWQLRLARSSFGAWLSRRFNLFARAAVRLCCARQPLSERDRQQYLLPYSSPATRLALARFVQDIPLAPKDPSYVTLRHVEATLPSLRSIPACLIWGARDFVFDDAFLARWHAVWPNAEVHRFADCGHLVHEDAPDEVLRLIQCFLRAHPAQRRLQAS